MDMGFFPCYIIAKICEFFRDKILKKLEVKADSISSNSSSLVCLIIVLTSKKDRNSALRVLHPFVTGVTRAILP